ncbi:Protein RETICULATA-related, partial [Dillenia turbinata]
VLKSPSIDNLTKTRFKSFCAKSSGGEGDAKLGSGNGGGIGFNGNYPTGGGGGDDDDDREGEDADEAEFGPVMKFEEVMEEMKRRGAALPLDMLEAAKTVGFLKVILLRYLDLQGSGWPLGFAMKYFSMLRNRMLADPSFLFKVGTEVCHALLYVLVLAQKRGKEFWTEFELYAADLLVGVVVDIALVAMLAPYARIGKPSVSRGFLGQVQRACAALPSSLKIHSGILSIFAITIHAGCKCKLIRLRKLLQESNNVFEAERSGCKFSTKQRVATYFYEGVMYGAVGFVWYHRARDCKFNHDCQKVGRRDQVGVFLVVSSNTRCQIINGPERVVEASLLAKKIPPVAMAFTVGVRFANNIYGGMQFVEWAKLSGVQ